MNTVPQQHVDDAPQSTLTAKMNGRRFGYYGARNLLPKNIGCAVEGLGEEHYL